MIKKVIILSLALLFPVASQGLDKPRFEGDGDYEKQLVVKSFTDKSPKFILSKFNKGVNPRWTFQKDIAGKEDLATLNLNLINKRWIVEGRMVWGFQADFCKPINSNFEWECWDAFYLLLPMGLDWHKEKKRIENEKFPTR
jgi:hypothetical protein